MIPPSAMAAPTSSTYRVAAPKMPFRSHGGAGGAGGGAGGNGGAGGGGGAGVASATDTHLDPYPSPQGPPSHTYSYFPSLPSAEHGNPIWGPQGSSNKKTSPEDRHTSGSSKHTSPAVQ